MTEEASKRSKRPTYPAVVAVAVVTSAIVSVGTSVAIQRLGPGLFTGGGESVEVPAILGMRPDTAGELLEGRGLRLVVVQEREDETATPGTIASQDPLRGSRVVSGSTVSVVLSTGMPQATVPDVVGRDLAAARAAIASADLEVGEVRETDEGEPGKVASTEPPAGARLDRGAQVGIVVVSSGIEVPDLANMNRRRAQEALESAGLKLGRVRWRFVDHRPAFIVLEQTPAAGERVPPESEVELILNEE